MAVVVMMMMIVVVIVIILVIIMVMMVMDFVARFQITLGPDPLTQQHIDGQCAHAGFDDLHAVAAQRIESSTGLYL